MLHSLDLLVKLCASILLAQRASQDATWFKVLKRARRYSCQRIHTILREIVHRVLFIGAQKLYLQKLLLMMQQ